MMLGNLVRFTLVAMLIAAGCVEASTADRLYVSKNGSDSWSGRLETPNASGSDGPLATLEGAKKAIRKLKLHGLQRAIIVSLREGTYFLDKPFELTAEDSGSRERPITYQAYANKSGVERVIISGGRQIEGFAPATINGHNVIAANMHGEWSADQLFVNNIRAPRTRLPKQGWYTIQSAELGSAWQEGQDSFTFSEGEINPAWRNLKDIEVRAFTMWVDSRLPIESVDEAAKKVRFPKKSVFWLARDFNRRQFARYMLENVREALDTPGQWYLDRGECKIYYYPKPGENWRKAEIVAPTLETLVKINGSADQPIEFVRFKNLIFSHTQHTLPANRSGCAQAAMEVPAAITAAHANNCEISHCEITRIGTYSVEFGAGCRGCAVQSCLISDMGAGGVKINTGSHRTTVSDNIITDGGKIFASAVGVWIAGSPHNKITNNEISQLNYSGVSVGWSWGYAPSPAVDNLIANNHIHHVGREILSDLAGIYTLGVSPGTVVRNNHIHDCRSFSYGGWGIYTDEGSSDILIENNVVYRTRTGGFHQHYGRNNTITNNIFACSEAQQLQKTRAENHRVFTFRHNIVYFDQGSLLGGDWSENTFDMDCNLYYDSSGRQVTFKDTSFDDWKKLGHDRRSIIADPLFVDPTKDDFRLKPSSPAFGLGFKQIDMSRVGPRHAVGVIQ